MLLLFFTLTFLKSGLPYKSNFKRATKHDAFVSTSCRRTLLAIRQYTCV